MFILKIWFHVMATLKKIFYKIIYSSRNLSIGKHTTWRRNFLLMIESGGKVLIGDNCFFNNNCTIGANRQVKIGEGTIFGENVKIYDHNHKFANLKVGIKEQGFSNGTVSIGSHCWIGSNVCILKNADIGDNCVIGAGCIITGKIRNNTIVKVNTENQYLVEKIK